MDALKPLSVLSKLMTQSLGVRLCNRATELDGSNKPGTSQSNSEPSQHPRRSAAPDEGGNCEGTNSNKPADNRYIARSGRATDLFNVLLGE
ncbi:MAG: hypothetical protein M3O61_14870 [Gemmatimonadota bacterium]|nr:hypothetical protein [Gemmatimonadota bacterium]